MGKITLCGVVVVGILRGSFWVVAGGYRAPHTDFLGSFSAVFRQKNSPAAGGSPAQRGVSRRGENLIVGLVWRVHLGRYEDRPGFDGEQIAVSFRKPAI